MQAYSRRKFLKATGAGAAALIGCSSLAGRLGLEAAAGRRPNVLFFLVDDMGWMDSTVYGSRYYSTPNIERLAKRGMLFTNAYAANPLCSPTRASILTGKYPCRFGLTTPAGHLPPRPNTPLMGETAAPWRKVVTPRSRRFMPLEEYTIAEAFKNAGYRTGFVGKWHLGHEPWWPKKQGFEVNIAGGHYPGPPSYHSPYKIKTLENGPEGEYLTDRLTDEALKYLEEYHDEPFLLCLWHYAVHAPFEHKKEITKTYRGKTDPRGKQGNPVMASMLHSMDESLGRVLDKLDELEITDDTIIIFTSDNGGNMYSDVEGKPPTNNYPLRNGKGSIYEGGVREPCIVIWPGTVEPGSRCTEVISSIDYYPTMLEMVGIDRNNKHHVDGRSLVPLLKQTGSLDRDAVFCHFPHYIPATGNLPATSVRKGDWKLIRLYGEGPDLTNGYELYNLKDDIGEANNLAEEMPEKVRELDKLITRHLAATGAIIPIKNSRYDPTARRRRKTKPVAGWRHSGSCRLSVKNGIMRVDSSGHDPYLHTKNVPRVAGPVTFKARLRSSAAGEGQAFWGTTQARHFHRTRSVGIDVVHDGKWHEISVRLPVKRKLTALRLDPARDAGLIEIDWLRLCRPNGKVLKTWDF